MKTHPARGSRTVVLAAVDGTDLSEEVIRTSARFCQHAADAELHLLHVIEPMPSPGATNALVMSLPKLLEEGRSKLDTMLAGTREHFAGRVVCHLAAGSPTSEILQLSADLSADVIVVGAHRKRTVERWLLGSVSEQIVRKAPCPVLVARPKDAALVPEIEPPCPDCQTVQRETHGATLWCGRHDRMRHRSNRAHTHYETPQVFAVGSLLIRPEG